MLLRHAVRLGLVSPFCRVLLRHAVLFGWVTFCTVMPSSFVQSCYAVPSWCRLVLPLSYVLFCHAVRFREVTFRRSVLSNGVQFRRSVRSCIVMPLCAVKFNRVSPFGRVLLNIVANQQHQRPAQPIEACSAEDGIVG